MARPRMEGMTYFPHDVDASGDEKLEALRALYKNDGYAFYFIILERVYRTQEAELDISNPAILAALIKRIGVDDDLFYRILDTSFEIGCFDKEAYDSRKILTSNGIKKRADEVKNMRVRWRKQKNKDNTEENKEENQEENAEETGESKVKKSKVKESKEKEIKINKIIPPKLEWIIDYCKERQNNVNPLKFYNHYEANGWKVGKNPMKDWQAAVREWEHSDYNRPKNKSDTQTTLDKLIKQGKEILNV
jgi:hypothetical protein